MKGAGVLRRRDAQDAQVEVRAAQGCEGSRAGRDARSRRMSRPTCDELRMVRALHPRWPYRRSHCRHDLHWLVRVHSRRWCDYGRTHAIATLRGCRRPRPHTS